MSYSITDWDKIFHHKDRNKNVQQNNELTIEALTDSLKDKTSSELGETETEPKFEDTNVEQSNSVVEPEIQGDIPGDSSSEDPFATGDTGNSGTMTDPIVEEEKKEPIINPNAEFNGKTKVSGYLKDLLSSIENALERLSKIPKGGTVVVTALGDLKIIVEHILETVYSSPLEATLLRYSLSVQEFDRIVSEAEQ